MKVRNITIGIKSMEEGLKEFAEVAKAIQHGHPPKRATEGVYFVDLEAMRKVLTPKRLELLQTIREENPGSVYELAHIAGRTLRNVQDDLALLARLDLVILRKGRETRKRIIPRVDYDRLQLQIPITHHHP